MGPTERLDFARKIPLSSYEALVSTALETARIIRKTAPHQDSAKLSFVYDEAIKLLRAYPTETDANIEGTVAKIFQALGSRWTAIASGADDFDISPLWERFMTEFPLGEYASMAAEILKAEDFLNGPVMEIGAGVGNTSRLVADSLDRDSYLRTDLNVKLLKEHTFSKKIALYDFNREGRWENLSCIFGVNALHCASDKTQSLKHLHRMLAPEGVLLLGEGTPEPRLGVPWALTYLCGFFDGWWDQGQFVAREKWFSHLSDAGFKQIEFAKMTAGDHDLGGIIWARK